MGVSFNPRSAQVHNVVVASANEEFPLHTAILELQSVIERLPFSARENRINEIITQINECPDLNRQDEDGNTLLHLVAQLFPDLFPYSHWNLEQERLVSALLDRGAKANIFNQKKDTAFHALIRSSAPSAMIKSLIQKGSADVNAPDASGTTPFHLVGYVTSDDWHEKAQTLADAGANIFALDKNGGTTFRAALVGQSNLLQVVQFFAENLGGIQAMINAQDNIDQFTPLHLIAGSRLMKTNSREAVKRILKLGGDLSIQSKFGSLPLHIGLQHSFHSTDLLIGNVDLMTANKNQEIPLHLAVQRHDTPEKVLQTIIWHTKDINAPDARGNTPLHYAASKSFHLAVELLLKKDYPANANSKDKLGLTPLSRVIPCLLKTVQAEISSFDPDYFQEIGTMIIQVMCDAANRSSKRIELPTLFTQEYATTINLLLDGGADPRQMDPTGFSAVDACFEWAIDFREETQEYFKQLKDKLNPGHAPMLAD